MKHWRAFNNSILHTYLIRVFSKVLPVNKPVSVLMFLFPNGVFEDTDAITICSNATTVSPLLFVQFSIFLDIN